MLIAPVHGDITKYLEKRKLLKKFDKQCKLFCDNSFHPSLNTELLEPRHMRIWSFRIGKKYRAIFIFLNPETIEIIDVNNHYK